MFQDENYGTANDTEFVDETLICKDCGKEFGPEQAAILNKLL